MADKEDAGTRLPLVVDDNEIRTDDGLDVPGEAKEQEGLEVVGTDSSHNGSYVTAEMLNQFIGDDVESVRALGLHKDRCYYLAEAAAKDINNRTNEWHESETDVPLHEWLGMTREEYRKWLEKSIIPTDYWGKREEDDHEGMIYNPISDTWGWL